MGGHDCNHGWGDYDSCVSVTAGGPGGGMAYFFMLLFFFPRCTLREINAAPAHDCYEECDACLSAIVYIFISYDLRECGASKM